jgi:hypothetical protein
VTISCFWSRGKSRVGADPECSTEFSKGQHFRFSILAWKWVSCRKGGNAKWKNAPSERRGH